MVKKLSLVALGLSVLLVAWWLFKPILPYIYITSVEPGKAFHSAAIEFNGSHWVCLIFPETKAVPGGAAATLRKEINYTITQAGSELKVVEFTDDDASGNTIPPNVVYLFAVVGVGKAVVNLDLTSVPTSSGPVKVGVVKDRIRSGDL